jgi:hypothetical protein
LQTDYLFVWLLTYLRVPCIAKGVGNCSMLWDFWHYYCYSGQCDSVVRSYLLHYGYQDTLIALDVASGDIVRPAEFIAHENGDKMVDEEAYALDHRRKLRQVLCVQF